MSSFLLAGRAWMVERIDHRDRIVFVRDAPRGKKPTWGGFLPQLLSTELCQAIRALLLEDTPCPYADEATNRALTARREDMADLLRREFAIQIDGGTALWWTFAGGRINYTLKYGLELAAGWKVVADNFHLRVEGDGVSDEALRRHIRNFLAEEFWRDPVMRRSIRSRLPEYRLSKFQDALPDRLAVEVVRVYLLDFDGAESWLSRALGPHPLETK